MLYSEFCSQNVVPGRGDICPLWTGSRWSSSGCIKTVVQACMKREPAAHPILPASPDGGPAHYSGKPIGSEDPFAPGSEPSLCCHHGPPGTGQLLGTAKAGRQYGGGDKSQRDLARLLALGRQILPAAGFVTLQSIWTRNGLLERTFGPNLIGGGWHGRVAAF